MKIATSLFTALFIFTTGCKTEEKVTLPTVTTYTVTDITTQSATSGGNITDSKGMTVASRGVCWAKTDNPTINDNTTTDGSGTGDYTSTLTNLTPATEYYLRAYATNKAGTAYGNTVTFTTQSNGTSTFAKGADIGWLQQMEATGYKFYNDAGIETDCIQILKDHGINSIRLRTWVNPSNDKASGHCSKDETVAMAVRSKNAGMRVMIDFHYSDSWADPSKQVKPAAWSGHDFTQLQKDVYDYTFEVMTALKNAGVTPEWVQVGNEITPGMLLPDGGSDNAHFPQLVKLINQGYDAVKAVCPTSKVILHIDQGNNNARFRWWFDNAKTYGAKYDIIGLSYYPYWLSDSHPDYTLSIDDLGKNMNDMVTRYGKEVMVVEVGGEDGQDPQLSAAQNAAKIQNTYDMLVAVLQKTRAVPNGKGLGVFYWEPQGARSWSHYALSAWGNDGKPTRALDAFLK
ncbi:MAG TPA: glycosyl hydrolase 53 family protein [Paludibacteraceae bacterium]|nr:glycosyl hydrolase 53 family protein [Paludibacteraceae bacterium]